MDDRVNAKNITAGYDYTIVLLRWLALVIDNVLLITFLTMIALVLSAIQGNTLEDSNTWILTAAITVPAYFMLMEAYAGFTVGKYLVRLKIVDEKLNKPGIKKAFIRTAARLLEVNPLFLGGLIAAGVVLGSRYKQRIGDMAAGTYVVKMKDIEELLADEDAEATIRKPDARQKSIRHRAVLITVIVVFAIMQLVIMATFLFDEDNANGFIAKSASKQTQITVPWGWDKDSTLNKDADIGVSSYHDESYVIVLNEKKSDFDSETTLEDYCTLVNEVMMEGIDNVEVSKPEEKSINGYDSRQLEIRGRVEGVDVAYLITFIETDNYYNQIIAWTIDDRYEQNKPVLQEITRSFKEISQNK